MLPGLFSPEVCLQAVEVCYPDYVQNIVKDQSFLVHIPGYPSQTPDSQGGKPP